MSHSPPVMSSSRSRDARTERALDPRAQQERVAAAFGKSSLRSFLASFTIATCWAIAAAYYFLLPPIYVSRWSFILPSANSGSSVTLDTIGQSSTVANQTFGSLHLSPKVIYKEIITSEQVRKAAAASIGLTVGDFGRVRVKLVDETALLILQINGGTPEQAQTKGNALSVAFNAQLDVLRRDEYEKRAGLMRDSLKFYQVNLDRTRERITDFQRATGFLSPSQFTDASLSGELLRRKLADKRSDLDKVSSELNQLMARVGLDPVAAASGLRLAADPAFVRIATAYADAFAGANENILRYGPAHPAQVAARMRLEAAYAEVVRLARDAQVDQSLDLTKLAVMINAPGQRELLRSVISNEATLSGLRKEVTAIEGELRRIEEDVTRMGIEAARLEALRKDHLVAEAVFSSAAARLDTNRTDLYASYPIVQMLAEPDLAEQREQPRLIFAIGFGMLSTGLVVLAWVASWIGNRFRRSRKRAA